VFIQTEETPNPATLKFLPGRVVMPEGTRDFPRIEDAFSSPLAQSLFAVEGVSSVFFGADFITVTKKEGVSWDQLRPDLLKSMLDHFLSGLPCVLHSTASEQSFAEDENEITSEIREIIDSRVRPAVAMDGGDIIFDRFEEGIVYVRLQGACSGCPSSTATLKSGIENMLRHYVPEVLEVRAV
jgi:Fe-S cluster biogenesis protein NfuA